MHNQTKTSYGNYTFIICGSGNVTVWRFGKCVGIFGSEKAAKKYVNSLIP